MSFRGPETQSIAELLAKIGQCDLPEGAETLSKPRGICVDDGMEIKNSGERIVPFSGAGIGEIPDQVREIYAMTGVTKIKPHQRCGKAELVLKQRGNSNPSYDEVDEFARTAAVVLAGQIGIEVGRTIGFNDGRKTQLVRQPDHHPASQAVITLSGRLPHNLLTEDAKKLMPRHFNLEGTFVDDDYLQPVAVGEMRLVNQIASGDHGVGIVPDGFQFTVLADLDDSKLRQKLDGLKDTFELVNDSIEIERREGKKINPVSLDVVGYKIGQGRTGLSVSFEPLKLR
jgi:hypothetical protein